MKKEEWGLVKYWCYNMNGGGRDKLKEKKTNAVGTPNTTPSSSPKQNVPLIIN